MAETETDPNWPRIRVWAWTDADGRFNISLQQVEGVNPTSVDLPTDSEPLAALLTRARTAARLMTGLDDPRAAEAELKRRSRERRSRRKANEDLRRAERRHSTPIVGDPSGHSVRTVAGGLPTLGRRQ
ncbi:hypothetical protein [Kitasatospora sp. Ki12]